MKRSTGLLVVAASLGGGLWFGLSRGERSPVQPGAGRPTPAPSASPTAELDELRQDMMRLRHQMAARATPALGGEREVAIEPAAPRAAEHRSGPEARAEAERARQAYFAGVESAFRVEPVATQWASTTASSLRDAIAGEDALRSLVGEVDCRSSTCRVEFVDDGAGGLDKTLPLLVQRLGRDLPSAAINAARDANGTSSVVLYLTRAAETAMAK